MKRSYAGKLGALSTAVAAALTADADAATVSVSQTVNLNTLLTASGTASTSGLFDISALLNAPSGSTVTVTSATVTGYAYSDAQTSVSQSSTGYYVTGYYTAGYTFGGYFISGYTIGGYRPCGTWDYCPYYVPVYSAYYVAVTGTTYQRDVTNTTTDAIVDEMQLALATDVFSDQVGNVTTTGAYGSPAFEYNTSTAEYYRRDRYNQNISSGDINLTGSLGAAALFALSSTQQLGFTATQLVGRAQLMWVRLDAVVDVTAPVPLPASGLLLGGALSLLGVGARVRRKKAA